ncbi:MAG: chorismate mutase [Pseudomonadota bacterium]
MALTAKSCVTMAEVREEIDRVDRLIVPLLLERLEYIRQAGHIKPRRDQVRDPARIEDVVAKAKKTAAAMTDSTTSLHAIHEKYVDEIYRHLIEWSIAHEFVVFDDRSDDTKAANG